MKGCPQRKGRCVLAYGEKTKIQSRKPSSGKRTIIKINLKNRLKEEPNIQKFNQLVLCFVPGRRNKKKQTLNHDFHRFSVVLIRGGAPTGIPGVNYTIIRGKEDDKRFTMWEHRKHRSRLGLSLRFVNKLDGKIVYYVRKRAQPHKLLYRVAKRGIGIAPGIESAKNNAQKRYIDLQPSKARLYKKYLQYMAQLKLVGRRR